MKFAKVQRKEASTKRLWDLTLPVVHSRLREYVQKHSGVKQNGDSQSTAVGQSPSDCWGHFYENLW